MANDKHTLSDGFVMSRDDMISWLTERLRDALEWLDSGNDESPICPTCNNPEWTGNLELGDDVTCTQCGRKYQLSRWQDGWRAVTECEAYLEAGNVPVAPVREG